MRIYHSHAMKIYGTPQERLEALLIKRQFPGCMIVNPGTMQTNQEKQIRGMDYCLELVEACDSLVFSRYQKEITSGVGMEVNHALSKGKPVYELQGLNIVQIDQPVQYLSREATVTKYRLASYSGS